MSVISIKQSKNYECDMQNDLLNAWEELGFTGLFKKKRTVLIKANVAGPFPPAQAATTNPQIIRSIARAVRRLGSFPIIGDGPNSNQDCFKICGYEKIAKEESIPLLKFARHTLKEVKGGYLEAVEYADEVLDADIVINAPKLKTHALVNYTGAVKNMFGAVQPKQRKKMHIHNDPDYFANILLDVFNVRIPEMHVMDAIVGMEGMGPTHGVPRQIGGVFCSTDGLALDLFCTTLIGYPKEDVPQHNASIKRGMLSIADADGLTLLGDPPPVVEDFRLIPQVKPEMKSRYLKMAMGSPIFLTDRCISCGLCADVCPNDAIDFFDKYPKVQAKLCINCYCCNELCPVGAVNFESHGFSR